ncbi:DNA alkylation repair protein [Haliscomenobacter hydrossis]|uniref:HEAT domain containing protein n=1 Tax=Haliscomenobacter hydrossis (strain ATCC 27775 / DSM 1100 / LMG 10767 / O) TaxID=760192 RepID=F4KZT9_HALH1|nr:DNA alkylation repair protein [Haliscomenobacter hydrossis]AEE50525.1 HEAT domain containing protein [Haliscomenobacter hydrossis DSM 1100]
MPEPLKNIFSPPLLEPFSDLVQKVWPPFAPDDFLQKVFDDQYEKLELKQRTRHIAHCLRACLPEDYRTALGIVQAVTQRYIDQHGEKLTFQWIFLPEFIEAHGVHDLDASLPAIETITRWSSCEFTVRPFLLAHPERMYAQMLAWSKHPSAMVRRLSSEGIRPRLPWGMGVPALKRDPAPILPILENLKHDPAETVRRSVANNLNDIAKEHPDLVLDIAKRWLGLHPDTDWIVRHACRGLLKNGNARALAYFGFEKGVADVAVEGLQFSPSVNIGGRFDFSFLLINRAAIPQSLRLEYQIDYQTLSGKTSQKVFKIKEVELAPGQEMGIERYQRFQDFTTRKHYPGEHALRILVNGLALAEGKFMVK